MVEMFNVKEIDLSMGVGPHDRVDDARLHGVNTRVLLLLACCVDGRGGVDGMASKKTRALPKFFWRRTFHVGHSKRLSHTSAPAWDVTCVSQPTVCLQTIPFPVMQTSESSRVTTLHFDKPFATARARHYFLFLSFFLGLCTSPSSSFV